MNKMEGVVFTGLGEGKYYMSLNGYLWQFTAKLGFKPFAGTLNLRVNKGDALRFTSGIKEIHVEGFKSESRTFGGLNCFPAVLSTGKSKIKNSEKIKGAVVIPERTHYDQNIVEFIAPINLRKKLRIHDGDTIIMEHNW